jgi:hypothetical protein
MAEYRWTARQAEDLAASLDSLARELNNSRLHQNKNFQVSESNFKSIHADIGALYKIVKVICEEVGISFRAIGPKLSSSTIKDFIGDDNKS